MNTWWRAYNEAVHDPKLQLLPLEAFRAWFNLMCLVSGNEGTLPPLGEVAYALRVSEAKVASIVGDLVVRGLFHETQEKRFTPHNWNGRQYKSDVSTDRVAAFRQRQRNGAGNVSCNVSETATETPPDTEQIREKKEATGSSEPVRPKLKYPAAFEGWWLAYPRTPIMSKKEAIAAWQKLSEPDRLAAVAALPKYAAWLKSHPDHPTVHACRFLSQRRFDGFEEITPAPAPLLGFYAADGSEELDAWDVHWKATKGVLAPRDNRFGWWFPTQWPPGHEVKNGTGTQHGTQGIGRGTGRASHGTSGAQAEAAGVSGREGAAADSGADGDGRAAAPAGPARGFTIE